MKKALLVSIHPQFFYEIVSRRKIFEYRKSVPKKAITHLVFYCTSPVSRIAAVAEVLKVMVGKPADIWTITSHGAGITYSQFRSYYIKKNIAVAFTLGNIYTLTDPQPLSFLARHNHPPQQFCYLDDTEIDLIFEQINHCDRLHVTSVVFVGGFHGAGKTFMCAHAQNTIGFHHVIASQLVASNHNDRLKTRYIDKNQSLILKQLNSLKKIHSRIILDGHFTLFNRYGSNEQIEVKFFEELAPTAFILVKDEPSKIQNRLKIKDDLNLSLDYIDKLQQMEEAHAVKVSECLDSVVKSFEYDIIVANLH